MPGVVVDVAVVVDVDDVVAAAAAVVVCDPQEPEEKRKNAAAAEKRKKKNVQNAAEIMKTGSKSTINASFRCVRWRSALFVGIKYRNRVYDRSITKLFVHRHRIGLDSDTYQYPRTRPIVYEYQHVNPFRTAVPFGDKTT